MRKSFFIASLTFLAVTAVSLTLLALTASRELGPGTSLVAQFLPPDFAPPAVSIIRPLTGSILTETATVTAIATDNTDVAGVRFFLNAASLAEEDQTFPYEFIWNTRTASNTAHLLRASARDAAGNRATSTAIEISVRNPPLAPANLTASGIAPTQIKLSWKDNATDEEGFTIERSADGIVWSIIRSVPDDIAQFTDDGLAPKTKYYYRVRASSPIGESPYTNVANATTPENPPSETQPPAPTNLKLKLVHPVQVRLMWTDNSVAETRFLVERSRETGSFGQVAALAPNTNFYIDAGLSASTTYRYRIKAEGAATSSLYSNVASITTPQQSGTSGSELAAPANLHVVATSPYAIRTTWEDRSIGEDGFALEHSSDGIVFKQVNSYSANATVSTYTGLVPGSRHFYRLRAFRGGIYSLYSNVAEVRMPPAETPPPPGPPPVQGIRPFTSTLSVGVCNAEVTILQGFLRKNPALYPEGIITGCFYGRTEAAVKRFQAKYGIDSVGTVGPRTRLKLNDLYAANATP